MSQTIIERNWPLVLAPKPMPLGAATRVITGLSALLWLALLYLVGWLLSV